jgi:lysine/ornithine N-monooxygenase
MGARESSEMATARYLVIVGGLTPYVAAKQTGLTRSAIYMSSWYKEWRDAKCKKK